ncbi:replication fork protection component Swi3-domain-containing protein [Cubamyces lactineus]|nr:replication fork protection component Swi3-domain-containing protein [Cubamyces lactineus]
MASLDDIWDAPAETSARSSSPPARYKEGSASPIPTNTKRPGSSRPLFLDSGSEDESAAASKSQYASKPASNKPDIDAFFADLDDDPELAFQDLAPSLDVEALKRQADAKLALTPHQILPSSSPPRDFGPEKSGAKGKAGDGRDKDSKDDAPKKKPKRPKLDEGRLCGPNGFPALAKQAKGFKPKGKGHELRDLDRLMNVYQFWAHQMNPGNHFIDTVQRVEKLCHSKRMHVALSVWRDEAHGLLNGRKIPGPDDPLSSDSDSDREIARHARLQSEDDKSKGKGPQDVPIATDDERSSPARSTHRPSLPPSSPSASSSSLGALDDDFDIDAMIREDEAARAQQASTSASTFTKPPQATYGAPRGGAANDEDEAMWDAVMDDFADEPYVPPQRHVSSIQPSASAGGAEEDIDDDMWDMVREMDTDAPPLPPKSGPGQPPQQAEPMDQEGPPAPESSVAGVDPSRRATNDEGWDEMYA